MNNLEDIIPHENDVLLGRGNFVNAHPGNKQFRAYVEIQRPAYEASRKCDKPLFAKMIIHTIYNLVPPGRFLRQDNDTEAWIVVDDRKAYSKTRQALREKSSNVSRQRTQPMETIPHSMASSKMAASTIGRLHSILAEQLEMAALHRARESPVYDTLQHSFVLNQCNSAPYIPAAAAPSSTLSPSSVTCTDQLDEANPLHFQYPTEQPTQMSSRWMTESWTKEEFALEDTDQYGINDVNHANLLNTDNVKQANVNDNVMTVRESFMNNTSFADADQFSINDGNHAGLLSAHDTNQDNANDDAITVRESFVDNETFIPEHSKVATKDVDSPPLQSTNYKHLKNNKMHSDAGPNASSLSSFTCASAYKAWWHSTVESQDTKSTHMSDRILEKSGVIDASRTDQDNVDDDAIKVREPLVSNEIFIPEHSEAATRDVDASPKRQSLQSINYKHLKNNNAGHNASSLSSCTLESQDTKSAHMSDRVLEKDGILHLIDASRTLKPPTAVEENHISVLTDMKNLSMISSMSDLRLIPHNSRDFMAAEDNQISDLTDLKHLSIISDMSDLRPTCCNPLSPMAMEENDMSNLTDMKNQSYTLRLSDLQVITPHASLTMPFKDEESLAPEKDMELIKQSSFSSMIDELLNSRVRRNFSTATPSNHLANLSHRSGIRSICESISFSDSIFSMSESELTHWASEVARWEEEEEMKEDYIMQE